MRLAERRVADYFKHNTTHSGLLYATLGNRGSLLTNKENKEDNVTKIVITGFVNERKFSV